MEMVCRRCNNKWDYKGKRLEGWDPKKWPLYITCTKCHYPIPMREFIRSHPEMWRGISYVVKDESK